MVVGRVEMTKTDACSQEILCLPRETDSIIGVKFGQTRNSSPQEIREFTTENAETVGGRANRDSQEKQVWLSARSAASVVNTCCQAVKLSSSSVAPADAGTGRRR